MKAFTVLELIISILIIGIIAGISYPNMARIYYDYQLDTMVTNFSVDLRYILNEALSKSEIPVSESSGTVYKDIRFGLKMDRDNTLQYRLYTFKYENNKWVLDSPISDTREITTNITIENFEDIINDGNSFVIIYTNTGIPTKDGINPLDYNNLIFKSIITNTEKHVIIDINTGKPRIE